MLRIISALIALLAHFWWCMGVEISYFADLYPI
jgi:hypothetical protein